MKISSLQNGEVKRVLRLSQKSSERKKQKRFVVEGIQENAYALENGFIPESFYIQESLFQNQVLLPEAVNVRELDEKVYAKIAYRGSTEGIVGVYQYEEKKINFESATLVLVLEGIEKPGNLGAILRSALAFGVHGIILSESKVDVFNPNVIRSSVGAVFTLPIQSMSNKESATKLQENNFTIYGTEMHQDFVALDKVLFRDRSALVFGTENSGLTTFWDDYLAVNYLIPMQNNIDSLNLSNAVAISLYQYNVQKKPFA